MRRIVLLCLTAVLSFAGSDLWAQDRTISGKVTSKEDGSPLPGINVIVKGTTVGTTTDADGGYSVSVPNSGTILVFSFIGLATQEVEIGSRTAINIDMEQDVTQLTEVIVTALGEKREKKAIGYAVQEVKGDKLTFAKSTDINSALAGKVAGVQLTGSPSSSFDNANIIIRGVNTLAPTVASSNTPASATGAGGTTFGNTPSGPLYIVDGTPSDPGNIIMDNVESITVLKGASATALYGNRAANGVVVITMKRGTRNNTPKVEMNLGVSFEKLYIMPEYQNEYAGGYSSSYANKNALGAGYLDDEGFYIFRYDPTIHPDAWAAFEGQRMLEYGADESWGPKINGQQYRPYYSWYSGSEFGTTEPLVARPDNVKNFFRTGVNFNNSVSVSGGSSNTEYRITYANQHRTLTLPNAYRDQNQIGLTGSHDIGKLTVSTDVMYTSSYTKGRPVETYRNDGLNVTQNFNQWFQRQLDISRLKNYRTPEGDLMSWNIGDPNGSGDLKEIQKPQYWDSPYFVQNENYMTEKRTRLSGNIGLNYKLSEVFNLTGFARINAYNAVGDLRIATGGLQLDDYSIYQMYDNETNYEANLNFKKTFNAISLHGFVGTNLRKNSSQYLFNSTEGGLSSPNYFDIAASIARPTTARVVSEKEVRSVYGKVSLGYKDFIFLDGTLRNDWSSTLPVDNNSYLYPSISTSFVFSELLDVSSSSVLSFGKVRASYAQVGSDLGYNQVYTALTNGNLYNGQPSVEIGNQYRTGEVKPALSKSWEVGTEMKLFGLVGLDFAYYEDNNINQILSLDVSTTSGYSNAQINAGNIQRKGWEASVSATPVNRGGFNWDITLNLAHNTSFVKELADGLSTYTYATSGTDIRVEAQAGEKWGNIYGRNWQTNAAGQTVFSSSNGTVAYTTGNKIGNIQPTLTGGMYNTISYKNFDFSFSLDFQQGGMFYSLTKLYNVGAGLSKYTTGVNDLGNDIRTYPAAGGGVRMDGVIGAAETPLTVYVPARRYFYTNLQRDSRNFIMDADYIKLREIRLGYTIPSAITSRLGISKANFGVMVNNAWLIAAPAKKWGIDPSEIENYWYEGGQLSSSRTTGFNLKLTL
ncbi:SusC/RagA family TonB-linked outer membrane protein [Fulvivirgaceae bacterium PWU4]|uniref:SusC/RagA family TonB-linked outer membrane protein n=1 Tax=Chryseosolibacter histidini TaxID=2782349 RepID=A0AAP2DN94_9BACT|nr:SusC/RagA family TonB-linked outer membrane protein [Chryseosolibacter histidini]MBT1699496.1 SusC/RagA family TonB-linked outer membrane protein [Chryseosolibacter histidini]